MAKYFNYFPKVPYNLKSSTIADNVTNIVTRFTLQENLKENTAAYFTYEIRDGDTPEIIASKIYDSPERHWIVLLMNNIIDPQYDWPLKYDELNRYIDSKYSSPEYADTANTSVSGLSWAQNTANVKFYYKVVRKQINDIITIDRYEVDANTYANNSLMGLIPSPGQTIELSDGSSLNLQVIRETKTHYNYEVELNESKRTIKLLKEEFVAPLEEELRELLQ
jgi:hypothetical protein